MYVLDAGCFCCLELSTLPLHSGCSGTSGTYSGAIGLVSASGAVVGQRALPLEEPENSVLAHAGFCAGDWSGMH